jgi:hypothetical protein
MPDSNVQTLSLSAYAFDDALELDQSFVKMKPH